METTLMVCAIAVAVAQAVRMLIRVAVYFEPAIEPGRPPRDKYPTVYLPQACGKAAQFAGLTGPCARRPGHGGRCMPDAEIEHLAEYGRTPTVVPVADVDAAELVDLARHVEECPTTLLVGDRLDADERVWLARLRAQTELLVDRGAMSDWGPTRG